MSGNTSTLTNSPVALQAGSYSAQQLRNLVTAGALPGIVTRGDFAVSQRAAGANMSVDIAAGQAFVAPTAVTYQGGYLVQNDSSYNTSSDGGYTWTAADGSNPRIDLVCLEVKDNAHDAGGVNGFRIRIVDGTPSASATHQLEVAYWPAVPSGCVPIAAVHVPASDTTLADSQITNLNPIGGPGRTTSAYTSTAETTTSTSYTRLSTPDLLCSYLPANSLLNVRYTSHMKLASDTAQLVGVGMYLNGSTLLEMNSSNAAPSTHYEDTSASPSTYYGRVYSGNSVSFSTGATADLTDATSVIASAGLVPVPIMVTTAGWYVLEVRYKVASSTLTVRERRLWGEVLA